MEENEYTDDEQEIVPEEVEADESQQEVEEESDDETDYKLLYESEKEAREKAEKAIIESKKKAKEQKTETPRQEEKQNDYESDAVLARLENRGVMESEDQKYVLRFAKAEGISPVEALQDEVVKDKLAFFKKQREQKAASPVPGNRVGSASGKSVDYYIQKGIIPTDPDMADKVQTEIARRARAGA